MSDAGRPVPPHGSGPVVIVGSPGMATALAIAAAHHGVRAAEVASAVHERQQGRDPHVPVETRKDEPRNRAERRRQEKAARKAGKTR